MKWFKHDTDASIDAKLQELLLDYGAAGYGLYWYCVELIAQGVSENNITFELEHDARIIARNLNLTVQETKDMMRKMVDLDLFSITKNEKLACYALAKRIDKSMTGNIQFREMIQNMKDNHDFLSNSHDSVMTHHDFISPEEKRREEKRLDEIRKEGDNARKRTTFTKPTLQEVQSRIVEMNYSIDAERFISYYESNGWMVGRTKMKDWKAALTNWSKSTPKQTYKPTHSKVNTTMQAYDELCREREAQGRYIEGEIV
jgi:hypothetical protein